MSRRNDQGSIRQSEPANAWHLKTACKSGLLLLLLLLALPAVVEAQSYTNNYGTWKYTTTNDAITITGYSGPGGSVTIPDTINGLPVTSVGDNAFEACESLTNLTIPNSVTSLGYGAFNNCNYLTNVTMGRGIASIGGDAFFGCTSLTSVSIPDTVRNIGDGAFAYCASLTSITIGSGVTNIEFYAFSSCGRLTSVYFRGNAPSFGVEIFADTRDLFFGWTVLWDPATLYFLPGTAGWETNISLPVLTSLWVTNSGTLPTQVWKPQVETSHSSFGVQSNQFGFNINWASGMTVVIEATTNLANPTWYPLQTNTLTANPLYFSDPQWTNYSSRFYRVTWP